MWYITYFYGMIWSICAESAVKYHQLTNYLTAIFPGGPEFVGTRTSPFWIFIGAKGDGGGGNN